MKLGDVSQCLDVNHTAHQIHYSGCIHRYVSALTKYRNIEIRLYFGENYSKSLLQGEFRYTQMYLELVQSSAQQGVTLLCSGKLIVQKISDTLSENFYLLISVLLVLRTLQYFQTVVCKFGKTCVFIYFVVPLYSSNFQTMSLQNLGKTCVL